jgi:hypothetical protein
VEARRGQQRQCSRRRRVRAVEPARALEQGMMIAEVNMAIGAIDHILKLIKDGKSNHRELTNASAELDHWRALQTVRKG